MSTPYDQNPGQQQYGQPPQFGAPVPPQPAQPPYGQQPQGAPAWGQPTQPFPDPNANPYAAGNPYGAGDPNANPYGAGNPYAAGPYGQQYGGVPAQPKKQRGGAGRFFALAIGTVLGRVVLFLLIAGGIAIYHFATADPAQRNSNGQVSQSGSMAATDLKVGDCFDAPSGTSGISTIKAIPCTQSHDSQVYAEPQITESSYPGDSTLKSEAEADCGSNSAQSVISSSAPSSAQIAYYFPQDEETFTSQRYIICALESDSQAMTQSYVSNASSAS